MILVHKEWLILNLGKLKDTKTLSQEIFFSFSTPFHVCRISVFEIVRAVKLMVRLRLGTETSKLNINQLEKKERREIVQAIYHCQVLII